MRRISLAAQVTSTLSPADNSILSAPSKETIASVSCVLRFFTTLIRIRSVLSNTTLLEVSECGDIGVTTTALAFGLMIGPPADRFYPVDPVGVATITPSASYVSNS